MRNQHDAQHQTQTSTSESTSWRSTWLRMSYVCLGCNHELIINKCAFRNAKNLSVEDRAGLNREAADRPSSLPRDPVAFAAAKKMFCTAHSRRKIHILGSPRRGAPRGRIFSPRPRKDVFSPAGSVREWILTSLACENEFSHPPCGWIPNTLCGKQPCWTNMCDNNACGRMLSRMSYPTDSLALSLRKVASSKLPAIQDSVMSPAVRYMRTTSGR